MSLANLNLSKAFSSQYEEKTLENLPIHGEIPGWLSGSFVSNGPAQFEVGSTHFDHWFDGFAMLKKFDFKAGVVSFQNRFLRSTQYIESNKHKQLKDNEFGTWASSSIFPRIQGAIRGLINGASYDNCNVNTCRIAETWLAMTESSNINTFDVNDLSTIGAFKFNDAIRSQLTLAHPHFDRAKGELINVSIDIGRFSNYHVYKIDPVTKRRHIIQTYSSDKLFYHHSFSLTTNYIILFKSPLLINKYKLMLGYPFNETLQFHQNLSSFFIIIDRRNGKIVEIETESFVCLHSVNAYEYGSEIILDLVCYGDGNPYDKLYLAKLRSTDYSLSAGEIRRYVINPASKNSHYTTVSAKIHEFPRINYALNGNNYQFAYTTMLNHPADNFFNALQKLAMQTGNITRWQKPNYYLGEAVFVAKNGSLDEDEGVLLTIAFDLTTQSSALVVIDAQSMQQIAEVCIPLHLPFGLHGNFYINR
ncbi:MAG: carotenoid oxygenase family protein [Legionella sp.]|nr:carotenoid oxygenase family protein [Legionella sp.]